MSTAKEDLVEALEKVEAAAAELATNARALRDAVSCDPPRAAIIAPAVQAYGRTAGGKHLTVPLKVVAQAVNRWVLLNPGVSQEKF